MSPAFDMTFARINQRDLVSLTAAALCLLMVLMAGHIQMTSEEKILPPLIGLVDEASAEEKKMSVPLPAQALSKVEVKPSQVPPSPKDPLAEKVSKSDEASSPALTSDASRQSSDKPSAATATSNVESNKLDLDNAFEQQIRQLIEASKRYPTGREVSLQKPQGVVTGCVVLQRDGSLQEMKVTKSSTYPILDNAAKRLLANLAYPSMPPEIYRGQSSHLFCVNLDFKVPA